jgi:predicted 3-demethylubiquinone-9 3-methyltransferase (glyoxalase superfamily)
MQKITPFLWFNDNAEEAVSFYTSIFKDSKVVHVSRYTDAGPGPVGSVMVAAFELNGQTFNAINGGPHFKFSGAISFVIDCQDQKEVDHFWEKLSAGGQQQDCGWLIDKFGVYWQVVPKQLTEIMSQGDAKKIARVMKVMFTMKKLNIQQLVDAANGK